MGFFVSQFSFAQAGDRIDSLKRALQGAKGEERYTLLQELFKAHNQTDYNASLQYAREAYLLAESLGDSARIVEGGRMMAFSLLDLGKNEDAINILRKVIAIAKRNQERYPDLKPKIKFLLNNAGIAYMYRGNYDSSLLYHFESLEIREEEGDKKSFGTALNNIGLVYFKLRNYDQALQYYLRSIENKKELNDERDIEKILINVGLCYNQLKQPGEAIKSFTEALLKCSENCPDAIKKEVYYGLGSANVTLKKYEEAERDLKISLEISKAQNDKQYWIENILVLSKIERERKDFKASLVYLTEAKQFESESQFTEPLINLYKELSAVYDSLSDYENASIYQSKYIVLKDSIISGELIKNLAKIQTTYAQRENLKAINERDRILLLQTELLKRQQIQYFFIVAVTILASGLAMVLIWANRKQKKHNAALNEAKRVITRQNEQLLKTNEYLDHQVTEKTQDLFNVNDSLMQVNEELDNFIYRTSHDIRGPLVTLKGVCNVAQMDVKDTMALDYLKKIDHTSGNLNTILSRLLVVNKINQWKMEPAKLDLNGFISHIVETEKANSLPAGMKIEYSVDTSVTLISDRFLLGIAVENLIGNAIKFYNEKVTPLVKIVVDKSKDERVRIRVIDNGIGINTEDKEHIFRLFIRASDRSATGGIGLYLSKMATHRLGGEVLLAHTSPEGSEFHMLLPIDLTPVIDIRNKQEELHRKEKEKRLKQMLASADSR